ncbi:hypothetical protein F0562_027837 [Nyssa sinensis]|uniref:Leucine-rich repeat-containing N-terminal plant-type domain-containing protein n=1 Tax=Nyssa sinensis TaxID=561372 RepID=A0A5J5B709_9ASTE|nr:hypothetical protein F0562_027837 [Nyssa sinensis]
MLMHLLFLLSCSHLFILTNSSSSTQPLYHEDESSALWQFKESFSISEHASDDPSAYPKVASWKLQGESNDCCLWDGVECDEGTGHVIGLDLSSSFLYGSINSNSSLFRLAHLQRLHLADNNFNYSQIPPAIGNLSELRSLNLFLSLFSGQIPLEISMLTQLTSLNLSLNPLKLHKPSFGTLVQNLTRISELSLSNPLCHEDESSALWQFKQSFSISGDASNDPSTYPKVASWKLQGQSNDCCLWDGVECDEGTGHIIGLDLSSSLLYGSINSNSSLFHLAHLQRLHLVDNDFNYSQIPSAIGNLAELRSLDLSFSLFNGQIPLEISMLTQLTSLDLSFNPLKLHEPSLGTLVQNLTRISELLSLM